ncbi:uncharacterized protein LOC107799570 isoform X2 [Nicotiana tabacum]|uniref:Uncharacterized protein isoform X2 n=3 Tax=Nicotiana tabacum TaxID=4097 RepID=A0A1S4ANE1_TOBAC|nr:PREDICTED: uncharacterized protein LOC107799570 isoform X2 [Nicotiana tabacum]
MKSRGPYKKIQGGDGQEVQDLTRSLCMSLGEVISHTPVHQLSHLHKDLSSLLECFTSIAQVPCLLEVVLQYARWREHVPLYQLISSSSPQWKLLRGAEAEAVPEAEVGAGLRLELEQQHQ